MKTKIFLVLSFFVISYSCYKEDAVEPTADKEKYVNVDSLKNQGSNIYQDRLISYFDKYNILTMYRFDSLLFYYEIVGNPPYKYKDAEEPSVGSLLDIIDEMFYQQLGNKAILKFSPLCVLLVSDLEHSGREGEYYYCYFGLYCLTFSGADERVFTWNNERKIEYKNDVTSAYLIRMIDRELVEKPIDFTLASKYKNPIVSSNNYKEYGFVKDSKDCWDDEVSDLRSYIKLIVSTRTEDLTAMGGLLDPEVDKKGFIRKKYGILVKFFKQHDIDIVKIGNYQIK